jgi:hypothetical protein
MRTWREYLPAGAGLLGLFFLLFLLFCFYFDRAATKAANRWLAASFPYPAGVKNVKLRLWKGNIETQGLRIESPPGFAHREFLTLKKAEMDLRLTSLWSDEIVADSILADGLIVRLENVEGRRNAREIFRADSVKEGGDAGKRFQVRRIVLLNTLFTYPVPGGEQVAAVARMEIEDPLGKGKAPFVKDVIARMVARSIRAGVGQAAERAMAGSFPAAKEKSDPPEGRRKPASRTSVKTSERTGR